MTLILSISRGSHLWSQNLVLCLSPRPLSPWMSVPITSQILAWQTCGKTEVPIALNIHVFLQFLLFIKEGQHF